MPVGNNGYEQSSKIVFNAKGKMMMMMMKWVAMGELNENGMGWDVHVIRTGGAVR